MALKADMPDFIDSGGAKNVGTNYVKNEVLPLIVGLAVAAFGVVVALGIVQTLKPTLSQIPVLGTLIQSGQGSDVPSGWGGM